MTIAFRDVFPVLAGALPEFRPAAEDWEDRLSYPFINDMVRFVSDRAYPEYEDLMSQFSTLLEKLISTGDQDVRDLAHEALDTLWGREEKDFVSRYFGPKTHEMWTRICAGEHGQ
jgi:hypothetical protein